MNILTLFFCNFVQNMKMYVAGTKNNISNKKNQNKIVVNENYSTTFPNLKK